MLSRFLCIFVFHDHFILFYRTFETIKGWRVEDLTQTLVVLGQVNMGAMVVHTMQHNRVNRDYSLSKVNVSI